ncbi:hypothetical protein HVH02_003870 [Salmonella enterica]|nr:hypothetical protein [Salmonella enterica]
MSIQNENQQADIIHIFIIPYSGASTTMGKVPVNDGWHTTNQGTIIAVSDARVNGTSDIGLNKDGIESVKVV